MSLCPYTFLKSFITTDKSGTEASVLKVTVFKNNEKVVDVSLPAESSRWLIDIMPDSVVEKVKAEGVPLVKVQHQLSMLEKLIPMIILELADENRRIKVWLE